MSLLRRVASYFRFRSAEKDGFSLESVIKAGEFQRSIGYTILDHRLFYEALSHRSYSPPGSGEPTVSNERLEFLGDSVLSLVVARHFFDTHSMAPEGELTKIRSRLVNRKALAHYAKKMGLERFLLVNPQGNEFSTRGMETILSDAYEAVIAAIYLDGGYDEAGRFIERTLLAAFHAGEVGAGDENYKSRLLEHSQASGLGLPRYVTIGEKGPDHDRTFTIEVRIEGKPYGTGEGKNKKDAEQTAAGAALRALGIGA